MTDWTQTLTATPTHIHTYARFAALGRGRAGPNTAAPAATTWVNGLGIYIPFRIPFPYLLKRVFWINGSTITSTSVDCGVYTVDGTLLISSTPTAMVGASTLQYADVTDTLLSPGRYYLAWSCNNTTNRGFSTTLVAADGRVMGLLQQSSVATLPATMTPAAYAGQGVPFCGITSTSTGF